MTQTSDRHALYLKDLIPLLIEKAREARSARDRGSREELVLANERLLAFHEVISLLQQQAVAFGIPFADLGLDRIDPERDLL